MRIDKTFAAFANRTSQAAGSPWAFCLCVVAVAGWAASGPLFGFSETWQLVINTGTTIITFLMVFLIQNTQNRDNAAIHAKLDDLILTSDAENAFVGIERMTDKELAALHARCMARARAHDDVHARVKKEVERRGGAKQAKAGRAAGRAKSGKAARQTTA